MIVEQAKTQLGVVVPIEEEEEGVLTIMNTSKVDCHDSLFHLFVGFKIYFQGYSIFFSYQKNHALPCVSHS